MRLLARIGKAGLPPARQRLKHKEWFVVRNACKLLGEMKDPELLEHIASVFEHEDERVKKAALQAVTESKLRGRAAVIANALPVLSPHLVEDALCELMHQADPESLPGLDKFFSASLTKNRKVLQLVINVIAMIQQENAVRLLSRISYDQSIDAAIRKAAHEAIAMNAALKARKSMEPDDTAGADVSQIWAAAGKIS